LYELGVWLSAGFLIEPGAFRFYAFYVPLFVVALLVTVYLIIRLIKKPPARLVQPAAPKGPADPDLESFQAVLREASFRLRDSSTGRLGRKATRLEEQPLFLLLGPPGSGKTSAFLHSDMEKSLLSGNAKEPAPPPTTVANVWFAQDAVWLDIAGRLFQDGPERWKRLLQPLAAKGIRRIVQQLQGKNVQSGLRGVVLFCELGETGKKRSGKDGDSELARQVRDRLAAVAEVFGSSFPVWVVLSKCDRQGHTHFSEFFAHLTKDEQTKALGCSFLGSEWVVDRGGEPFAVTAGRVLTRSLNRLYASLAGKRLDYLSRESSKKRKGQMYEYPRELRKTREGLVDFLVEAFRPDPLRAGPVLRGFYMTGLCKTTGPTEPAHTPAATDTEVDLGVTQFFRPDATVHDAGVTILSKVEKLDRPESSSRLAFIGELFSKVIAPSKETAGLYDRRLLEARRRNLFAAACGICLLGMVMLIRSWYGNADLIEWVDDRTAYRVASGAQPAQLSRESLESLERLRERVALLTRYSDEGPPWRLRWGLYAGDDVLPPMRELYFTRFRTLLLDPVSVTLGEQLGSLSAAEQQLPYWGVHDRLRAYLMMRNTCRPENPFLGAQAFDVWKSRLGGDPATETLAQRQFDFYAAELVRGRNPYRLDTNQPLVASSRAYLSKLDLVQRAYNALKEETAKTLAQNEHLATLAPNHAEVLTGSGEVNALFTKAGWEIFQQQLAAGRFGKLGDSCVLGQGSALDLLETQKLRPQLLALYWTDYVRAWSDFLSATHVVEFKDERDAARKLDVLSNSRSPLLAAMLMTARNTDFPASTQGNKVAADILKKFPLPGFKKIEKAAKAAEKQLAPEPSITEADVGKIFQPVKVVAPVNPDLWTGPNNQGYMTALSSLKSAIEKIAQNKSDPVANEEGRRALQSGTAAVTEIALKFISVGGSAELSDVVRKLLEEPLEYSRRYVERDPFAGLNAGSGQICAGLRGLSAKFPFRRGRPNLDTPDVTLEEFTRFFAPGSGKLWQIYESTFRDALVENNGRWVQSDNPDAPKLAPDFIRSFSRLALISKAFFANSGDNPGMTYIFQPLANPRVKTITMEIDGVTARIDGLAPLAKQFRWPGPAGNQKARASFQPQGGAVVIDFPVISTHSGPWAIFRAIRDADHRQSGSSLLEFSKVRGGSGEPESISIGGEPYSLKLKILEFPGGVKEAFDQDFFSATCAPRAVQQQ
jgi:type VI secretion system protein ImpL